MQKDAIRYLFIVLSCILFQGCSSNPKFKADFIGRRITITSEPSGAKVYQKWPMGQPKRYLGDTPLENVSVMVLKTTKMSNMSYSQVQQLMSYNNNFVFTVEKEGYKPFSGLIGTIENETVTYNVILEKEEDSTNDN